MADHARYVAGEALQRGDLVYLEPRRRHWWQLWRPRFVAMRVQGDR